MRFSELMSPRTFIHRLTEVAMPRPSPHAASGHMPSKPAFACEKHAAQNNSHWEIAA